MIGSFDAPISHTVSMHKEYILHYEILDIPLLQAEQSYEVSLRFYDSHVVPSPEPKVLRLNKEGTIADVLKAVPSLFPDLCSPDAKLRMLDVYDSRIARDYASSALISSLQPARLQEYRIEAKSLEEHDLNPKTHVRMQVVHFTKDATGNASFFGDPFYIVIPIGVPLEEVKKIIKAKLQVSDEDFPKYRFARIAFTKPQMLSDDSIVIPRLTEASSSSSSSSLHTSTLFGMLHSRPHSQHSKQQYRSTGIVIRR